jgi:hypothetical protein
MKFFISSNIISTNSPKRKGEANLKTAGLKRKRLLISGEGKKSGQVRNLTHLFLQHLKWQARG